MSGSNRGGRMDDIRFPVGREKVSFEGEELGSDDDGRGCLDEMPYHSRKLRVVEPEYIARGEGPSSEEVTTVGSVLMFKGV